MRQGILPAKPSQGSFLDAVVLTLIWPAFSVIRAFRRYREPWAKNILWLFTCFFGYTFIISGQMDSVRYTERLVQLSHLQFATTWEFIAMIYGPDSGYPDVIEPLITFTLSRFTSDGHILMAVFGLVFGFFYSRNLWYLFERIDKEGLRRHALPYLFIAALLVTIWAINGFRFWTACHVFIYGLFRYTDGKRWSGLFFAAASVLVHFSFVIPVILFILWVVAGNQLVPYFVIFFASFFISETNPQALNVFSLSVPDVFQERSEMYTNKVYIKGRIKSEAKTNWYVRYRLPAIRYATNALLVFVFLMMRSKVKADGRALSLLCYGLLLASLGSILSGVPSMVRFQIVSLIILIASLFILAQQSELRRSPYPVLLRIPFLLTAALYIIVEVRIGFDTLSPMAVFGNPIISLFFSSSTPLIDFIK